jgi:predicted methyltransferase
VIWLAARDIHRTEERLLRALSHGPHTYWELLRTARAQTHEVITSLKSLLDNGLITSHDGRYTLTSTGRETLDAFGGTGIADPSCPACEGSGLVMAPPIDRILPAFQDILAHRPAPSAAFDQGHATADTVLRRLALMARHGDLAGRDLLLLGDDDLTSIAAALSGLPRRIYVLDVDERIVNFVRQVARDHEWHHVHAEVYDAREDLPAHLHGQFDTFFTDPIDTLPGLLLFLSRCTQGLRGIGSAGYFGLSYLEASRRKWRRVQMGVLEMGYAFTDILEGFQAYRLDPVVAREWAQLAPVPPESPSDEPFYMSAVHRVQLVERPAPVYTGRVQFGPELYADDEFTAPEEG